jgi:hypothetical protein
METKSHVKQEDGKPVHVVYCMNKNYYKHVVNIYNFF